MFCVNNAIDLFNQTLKKIKSSGLYDELDQIYLSLNGPNTELYRQALNIHDSKINVIEFNYNYHGEFNTLNFISDFCKFNEGKILYLHSKGVTHPLHNPVNHWREYMEYFVIENFKDCLDGLQKNDTVGVNLQEDPKKHYSGNMWWANASHIRKLPKIENYRDRLYCEFWLLDTSFNTPLNLYSSNKNHYIDIFPRDEYLGKLKKNNILNRKVFSHTGYIGDIIAFLPIFKNLEGTTIQIKDGPSGFEPMAGNKYDSIKPLLESQDIEVYFGENELAVDYDVHPWRECYQPGITLIDAQARYLNVVCRASGKFIVNEPWLNVPKDPNTKGRVIFNRTTRYRNDNFKWVEVFNYFGDKALFVGTEAEHSEFCEAYGNIEYYITKDCYHVARAIAGADFFVGNQSSACWIAMGLFKPLLQEVFEEHPNSQINYPGAYYPANGKIDFNILDNYNLN